MALTSVEAESLLFESSQLLEQNGGYGNTAPARGPPPPGGPTSSGYGGGEYPHRRCEPAPRPCPQVSGLAAREAAPPGPQGHPPARNCLELPEPSGGDTQGHM